MSDVRRRFALPLLVLFLLFIGTCKTADPNPIRPLVADHDCKSGKGLDRKESPVLCVDDTSLDVDPDRIVAWDTTSDKVSPNFLVWKTKSGTGDLQVHFANTDCVDTPFCNRNGMCRAKAQIVAKKKSCEYTITLDGKELDPEAVIIKCCAAEEPQP